MPISAASDFSGEMPCSTGSNSGRSASLFFLMISRARSRDSTSCTWLVTASAIERLPLFGAAVAARPQEHVLAAVDQDAGFRLVARSDEIDGGDRRDEREHRRHDDPAALAGQHPAERVQIDVAGFGWCLLRSNGRKLCFNLGRGFGDLLRPWASK